MLGCSDGGSSETGTYSEAETEADMSVVELDRPSATKTVEEIQLNIEQSPYLDGVHLKNEVDCADCHEQADQDKISIPSKEVCIDCHGDYDALTQKLMLREEYQIYNPHGSPHGDEDCFTCHHIHRPFELLCRTCHVV